MTQSKDLLFIDVDTGIDDALALLYACADPDAKILGVSTVVGNVTLTSATRNTRAVLAMIGRSDIPVAPGAATPLSTAPTDASVVHGESGLGYAALPEPRAPASSAHGVDAIIAAARACAGKLTLVATGPLTNIALAVMREPDLPRLLKRFVIMGGAFGSPGNVTPSAEFNIWHDPEAARIVFRMFGGVGATPVVAIGLDVTRQTTFDAEDIGAFAHRVAGKPRGEALVRFIADSSRHYFELMEKWHGARYLTMHDPLALAVALDPTLVKTRQCTVDVETSGRITMGATIPDWRGQWERLPNAEVALAVEAERFKAMFFDAMARLAETAA